MEGACWARGGKLGLAVESEQATFCDLGLGEKRIFLLQILTHGIERDSK